jgi:serine/threonine protein phosphatase PrpC
MGQTAMEGTKHGGSGSKQLPQPRYTSDSQRNLGLTWGIGEHQGWRPSMEDEHLAISIADSCLFGVFDGHGGSDVAAFCARTFPEVIMTRLQGSNNKQLDVKAEALARSFLEVDRKMLEHSGKFANQGCTALFALVSQEGILLANAGDSRAIMSRRRAFSGPLPVCGSNYDIQSTRDHKPNVSSEKKRIEKAGGHVTEMRIPNTDKTLSRVDGVLAVSRSMGDLHFKGNQSLRQEDQKVSSMPDVTFIKRQPKDEFLILACDGIWDVLTMEQVVDMVRNGLRQRQPPNAIVQAVLSKCLARDASAMVGTDNMTMILIVFDGVPQVGTGYCVNMPLMSR